MSKAVATVDGTTIELDLSAVDKRTEQLVKVAFEKYKKEMTEYYKDKKEGKGVVEAWRPDNAGKLIESLKQVRKADVKEQWTIAIPAVTTKEVAAHLRDYVWVSEIIKGAPGDTVNIPYVKDFDFQVLSSVGDAFTTQTTGIVQTTTASLTEAGAWSDIAYEDIEKIDQNLLDEINRTFAHAAVRAEDKVLIELISASTTGQFAGNIGHKTGTYYFHSDNVANAIGKLIAAGKEVHPGDCVMYMNGKAYSSLLRIISETEALAYHRGDISASGVVTSYLGVHIVVGGEVESEPRGTNTGTCEVAFLFRGKRCLALAPKRDILIETDRQIATRKLRITGSHTFGSKLLDAKEAVRIYCNTVDGTI